MATTTFLKRVRPPPGSLLASLQSGSRAYVDCFSLGVGWSLETAGSAGALVTAASSPLSSISSSFSPSSGPFVPGAYSLCESLADDAALTAYMRCFYTSLAFAPERRILTSLGLDGISNASSSSSSSSSSPSSSSLASEEGIFARRFDVGESFGPFLVCHRGRLPSSRDSPRAGDDADCEESGGEASSPLGAGSSRLPVPFQAGSEAALSWGMGNVEGISFHAIVAKTGREAGGGGGEARRQGGGSGDDDGDNNDVGRRQDGSTYSGVSELTFYFGSAVWRRRKGSGSRIITSPASSSGSGSAPPPSPLPPLPPLLPSLFGPPHRLYSRALLMAGVDRYLRLELL